MRRVGVWAMGVCTIAASATRADLIERNDGSLVAGQVVKNESDTIQLRTGPDDANTIDLKRTDIKRVLTPAEELSANLQEPSADILEKRAAAYFRAGLQFDALICLERLVALDPKRASARPLESGGDWAGFRTHAFISIEARRINDSTRLLALAKRARDAADGDLCADLIRRAGTARGGATAARAAGLEMGVPVTPGHMIDLSPCLYEVPESRSITDEDAQVSAQQDRVFVHIPVRIDLRSELSLSKGVLRGRDAKSLYGMRPMRVLEGRPSWDPRRGDPVYERLDFSPDSGEMVFRNPTPPRRNTDDPPPRDRSGARKQKMRPIQWVALIFELRQGAVSAGVQLPGEPAEELDLSLIRHAREPIPQWSDPASPPPEQLVGLLERLERAGQAPAEKRDSLRATTLLALAKLDETRTGLSNRVSKEWRALTDQAVVKAIGCGDPLVGLAAWQYLAATPPAELSQLSSIISAQPNTHSHLACAIEYAGREADPDSDAAAQALAAILGHGEAVACARALDSIERTRDRALWFALAEGVSGAKKLELARLHGAGKSNKSARFAVGALIAGIDDDLAEPIFSAARRLGVDIATADDPILLRWPRLEDKAAQAAYLEGLALAGADLGGVWHSAAISVMARDVYESRNKTILAGWSAMVAAHRAAQVSDSAGMFPLVVARESADPDLLGLNAIATHGAPADRRSAINSLLALGYAEEVQRALGASVDKEWPIVLSTGVKKEQQLAILGLLARWSASGPAEVASSAMSQLSRILSEVVPDRSWQAAAAIKSGLTLEALGELSWGVDPVSSGAALRVAYAVGHMTEQERQRVAGAPDRSARLDEFKAVDLRRGQLVDGSYGVLAIVETTTRVNNTAGRAYWGEPVRTLMELPPLRLEVDVADDKITALLAGKAIGEGRAVAADRMIKPLPYYYGVLEALDGDEFVIQDDATTTQPSTSTRPSASRPAAVRAGPMVLPDTRARSEGPGVMAIDLGTFVDDTKVRAQAEKIGVSWPSQLRVTLRYHIMGTWVGCGHRQDLPATAPPGETRLLNIMLIVEKMNP